MLIQKYFTEIIKSNVLILLLLVSFYCSGQQNIPYLTEIITDNAKIFSNFEKEKLQNKLKDFETKTTTQIVVLTIDFLENETIESYALKVFDKNKLGQKNVDNGILILFSKFDRKVRIEVGYGLEATITDALASRIIREIMIPNFKEEKYFEGIDAGSSKVIELIQNPELIEKFLAETEKEESEISFTVRILLSAFLTPLFIFLFMMYYNIAAGEIKEIEAINFFGLYSKHKIIFLLLLVLAILLSAVFFLYFLLLIFLLVCFIVFLYLLFLGTTRFIKPSFEALISLFEDVFTGKVGVLIFPFYLLFSIITLTIGLICICGGVYIIGFFIFYFMI